MTKKLFSLLALCCLALTAAAQSQFGEKPKLVVGIVVDQMRWDYLDRYYDRFCEGGFRRMIDEGFSADNCLINYVPTVTAIGHTSAYTGTTPAFHGICGNNFYINGRSVVSCQDDSVRAVGSDANYGNRSPRNLLATTIGDAHAWSASHIRTAPPSSPPDTRPTRPTGSTRRLCGSSRAHTT